MRVFVDVGAHYGETLNVALNPKWNFDRIYSLEPSRACLKVLSTYRDPRLFVEPIALANHNGTATLYGSGQLGGSLYEDKKQKTDRLEQETITLVRASDWFSKLTGELHVKMNCEGSEADILADLLDSGEIAKIARLYVHFDIEKVAGQEHRRAELEKRLKAAGVRYTEASSDMSAADGVRRWLEQNLSPVPVPFVERIAYALPASPYDFGVSVLRFILPKRLFWFIGARFGRLSHRTRVAK